MDTRRYHFFCPPLKGDVACQSAVGVSNEEEEEDIEEKLYESTLDALLLGNKLHKSPVQRSIQQGYMQNIGFLKSVYGDDRFDLLRQPANFLNEFDISFHFEFFPNYFTINSLGTEQTKMFPYNKKASQIIKAIQLGYVSSNMCFLLACFGETSWVNGEIVIKITDYRYEHPKSFNVPLKLSSDVIKSVAETKNLKEDQDIEYQRSAFILKNPSICLDPSPDVARVNSVLDSRKKMWINEESNDNEEHIVFSRPPEVPEKHLIKKIDKQTPIRGIKVPSSILAMFEPQPKI